MSVKIVTDSNCDLPREIIQDLGITVVPLYINMDRHSYLDGVDISREEFYNRLPTLKEFPTTSAPGIDTFVKIYQALLAGGATHIISIHISSTLSNVANIARLAMESLPDMPISVFDSGQLTLGTGLQARAAALAARAGEGKDKILEMLGSFSRRAYTFATLNTLEFLRRSGRMNHLAYNLTSLLDIKPIIKMNGGVSGLDLVRTRKRSISKMIDTVAGLGELEELAVVHTNAPLAARELIQSAAHLFKGREPIIGEVTPVIGAHIGPGAVGFVAVTR